MAHQVSADEKTRIIQVRYSGCVDAHDLRNAIQHVVALVRTGPLFRTLSDFRDVESWAVSTKDLRELGRDLAQKGDALRVERSALIATRDCIYGDLRAWVGVTETLPFVRAVFRDWDAALRWLESGMDA